MQEGGKRERGVGVGSLTPHAAARRGKAREGEREREREGKEERGGDTPIH